MPQPSPNLRANLAALEESSWRSRSGAGRLSWAGAPSVLLGLPAARAAGDVGSSSGEPHPTLSHPSLVSGKHLAWLFFFVCGSVLPCPFLPAFPLPWYREIPQCFQFSCQLLSFMSDNVFTGLMPPTSVLRCRTTPYFNEIFKILSHCFQIYMVKCSGTDHSVALEVQTLPTEEPVSGITVGRSRYLWSLREKISIRNAANPSQS